MTDDRSMLRLALEKNFETKKRNSGSSGGGGGSQSNSPETVNGYDKSEVVSALQKCIRRNKEPEALYWASELMASGEQYRMWRRMVVIAAEDVGLADPDMVSKIWAMKQAHDFAREWNIPFLAVMMLCRAPKNREADDAAYMYELRRGDGWKIAMPPEAIDGHTRRGKKRLYQMADRTGERFEDLWNREFYFGAGLLTNYVEVQTDGISERYRKGMMKYLGLEYQTYDIDKIERPWIATDRVRQVEMEQIAKRAPAKGEVDWRPAGDENGELIEGEYDVRSFTAPAEQDVRYRVNLADMTCSCPAYLNDPNAVCKHLLAMRRELE